VTIAERRRARWLAARPAIAWTLVTFAVALVMAIAATTSLAEAQQACGPSVGTTCPDVRDPRVAWLLFAFFGVPLVWLLGLLLLAVHARSGRRT
jgi:hypothetical protein